jgi:hypothetical protein
MAPRLATQTMGLPSKSTTSWDAYQVQTLSRLPSRHWPAETLVSSRSGAGSADRVPDESTSLPPAPPPPPSRAKPPPSRTARAAGLQATNADLKAYTADLHRAERRPEQEGDRHGGSEVPVGEQPWGTSGSRLRRSMTANATSESKPPAPAARMPGDPQPRLGPCTRANTISMMPSVVVSAPGRSNLRPTSSTPTTRPAAPVPPQTAAARLRSGPSAKVVLMSARVAGKTSAPPMPGRRQGSRRRRARGPQRGPAGVQAGRRLGHRGAGTPPTPPRRR